MITPKNVFSFVVFKVQQAIKSALVFITFKLTLLREDQLQVVIGASGTQFPNWVSSEQFFFDITDEDSWRHNFGSKRVKNLLAEHVFEHLTEKQIVRSLECAAKFMISGAVFRIAVPDGYHPSQYYRDLVRPGGLEPAAADHKVLLTIDRVYMLVPKNKFTIRPVECFDRKGMFHSNYSEENGFISRSKLHYKGLFTHNESEYKKLLATTPKHLRSQFETHGISSTSLIVDLIRK